jgi:hypothetical protein
LLKQANSLLNSLTSVEYIAQDHEAISSLLEKEGDGLS